jgi:hypothetical protein
MLKLAKRKNHYVNFSYTNRKDETKDGFILRLKIQQ